jgi:hypothetical protein
LEFPFLANDWLPLFYKLNENICFLHDTFLNQVKDYIGISNLIFGQKLWNSLHLYFYTFIYVCTCWKIFLSLRDKREHHLPDRLSLHCVNCDYFFMIRKLKYVY